MHSDLGYSIDKYQLRYTRILCVAVAVLYPLVGHMLLIIDDTAIEFLSHRYLIGLSLLVLLGSTYFSEFCERHAIYFLYLIMITAILWVIWIVNVNGFSVNYTTLMITAIAATAAIILHWRVLLLFLLLISATLFYTIAQNNIVGLNPFVAVSAFVILCVVLSINNNYKSNITNEVFDLNKKLGRYNSDLELEVEQRTKLLKQKNKELENYTYLVSHDLKSPLTNATSFANLIERDLKNENYKDLDHHIKIINQSVNRMSSILSDLMIHGKIGLTKTEKESLKLHEILEEVIASNFKVDIEAGAKITIDSNLPKKIFADRQQLLLLLQNLINNGLKYNTANPKEINVSGYKIKDKIGVVVSDNGIGFKAKETDMIFDMFRRLHTKDEFEGTGLGLAICKRVVDNHEGTIKANSIVNGGSKFEFII